jgi:hypothetical protein
MAKGGKSVLTPTATSPRARIRSHAGLSVATEAAAGSASRPTHAANPLHPRAHDCRRSTQHLEYVAFRTTYFIEVREIDRNKSANFGRSEEAYLYLLKPINHLNIK